MKENMKVAIREAVSAFQRGSVPVGAVIIREGNVVSSAGNEIVSRNDPTAHAEILAIQRACASLNTSFLTECDIYMTLEPCAMCAQAISLARIRRLYFGAYDVKYGAVEHNARVLDYALHKPEIIGGVMEAECSAILKEFFLKKRQDNSDGTYIRIRDMIKNKL